MGDQHVAPDSDRQAWDGLAAELQRFRSSVGNPSYAEIARRISVSREEAGLSAHAARVARTTVYDAFRSGRARPNFALVREIGQALGAGDEQIDAWIDRGRDAGTGSAPVVVERAAPGKILVLVLACVAANLVGRELVDFLELPIYLDMIGTAVVALALGPWWGALVGGTTNVLGVVGSGWVSIPFGIVNIAGALVWGYGARRFGMGRSLPRFLLLNVIVAVACSLIAVPILVVLFDGSVGQGQDTITATFSHLTDRLVVAVGFSNMLTSLIDKLLSGFVALVVVTVLPAGLRIGLQMVAVAPAPEAAA
ncbi:MAG: hypothetical protein NTV23_11385 [Propionibacteriales bacterium]|nr:hypothetical protein [Propionibacteriales bacterium]